jgi:transcription elongation factor GreA
MLAGCPCLRPPPAVSLLSRGKIDPSEPSGDRTTEVSTTNEERHSASARLSAAARQRLEQELDVLRARRRELDDAVTAADGVDDRGDAAQRLEWADERSLLDDRIGEIIDVLRGRVDASLNEALADGTEVTIRFSDGSVETMRVVMIPEEAPDSMEMLTWDSPLGQALLGARPGDTITYAGPDGESVAEVLAIRAPDNSETS